MGGNPLVLVSTHQPTNIMTNDIIALVDYYEREKELPRERIIFALKSAFISAFRKMEPTADLIERLHAKISAKTGKVNILATVTVVPDDEIEDRLNQIPLSVAQKVNPDAMVGDSLDVNITPQDFGRIAVQTARQTMAQRIRDAEKELLFEEFKDRAGDLVTGTIRRYDKSDIYVDLGKFEGVLPSRERVPTEDYSTGDRMRFYISEVHHGHRGPEVVLSRSHPNLVRRLFESEVAEIANGIVEIRAIAREAGFRTKLAVLSEDANVDPVGACVGMRGARVKNIVNELNNEKVDIIEWTEDPAEFVRAALAPVIPKEITLDTEKKIVHVTVSDEKDLAKAIGRRGQNARLTSRMLRWDVQVTIYEKKDDVLRQCQAIAKLLTEEMNINEDIALGLVMMGGTTSSAICDFEAADLVEALSLPLDEATSIIERAQSLQP